MSARWRPFAEVSAAMPSGEPLGLKGYASVALPDASVYLRMRYICSAKCSSGWEFNHSLHAEGALQS